MTKITFENLPSTNTPVNASNLNEMQDNIEDAIDSVVESGSSANGNWVKCDDGTMICYGNKTFDNLNFVSWGSIYTSGTGSCNFDDFPQSFTSLPVVSVQMTSSYGQSTFGDFWIMSNINKPVSTTSPGGYQLVRATQPGANASQTLSYMAIGKWK